MQVKTVIAEIHSRIFTLPAIPAVSLSATVAQEIPAPAIVVEPSPPPDLDEIATRIVAALSAGRIPQRRDVNLAPWCFGTGSGRSHGSRMS